MTTAKQLRTAIINCARNALKDEPTSIDDRARNFVARLSGSMASHEEASVESALDDILGLGKAKRAPTDGA